MRRFWVLAHRYAGLAMAGFLVLVGLTGSLLAFLPEIDHALTPHLVPPSRPAQGMRLGELALKAQALLPQAEVRTVYVDESGSAYLGLEPFEDPATGQPRELGFNQLVLDAATGKELGRRTVGGLPTGRDNLMAFIYDLHMYLALATIGGWILGIVALVWTVDCFVGFYLTLPARRRYCPHPNPCMFYSCMFYSSKKMKIDCGLWSLWAKG
ncbi:MAG: PepSY-associated TM helix domain-containing protein, partial [Gammaproteobacteria bacterium]